MAEKSLAILVTAKGAEQAARSIGKVDSAIGRLGKNQVLGRVGVGIGNVVKNSLVLGTVAAGGLASFLAVSVKEGQAAAKTQQILATAITNSGKVSAANVTQLDAQSNALMNLAGIDDELIKSEQTRLVQMGLTGDQVAKLTPLILDMSKATGRDLLTSTIAVGKAVNGNVGGLGRFGIVIDKTKAKTDAYGAVVDALNEKFAGTTQALSGNLDTRLGALRENLANIREDVGIKLLPALTRIVDAVGTKLVPAFGKFVDRILPAVSSGLDKFASMLSNGGAEKAVDAIATSVGALVDLLKIAAEPVKTIVGAFMALPKELQTVLVGAFAVNKLSGGVFGSVAGDLLKGGIKGALGIQAGVVNINAGVVNGGGLGGGIGANAAGAVGGFLGPGAVAATVAVAVPLVMGYLPRLFPGEAQLGAGAGSQPALRTPTAGTINSQTVAMMQGLMPSFRGRASAAGAIAITPGSRPDLDKNLPTAASVVAGLRESGLLPALDANTAAIRASTQTNKELFAAARGVRGNAFAGAFLSKEVRSGKKLGAGDVTVAEALVKAQENHLGKIEGAVQDKKDLQSANYELGVLAGLQRTFQSQGDTASAGKIVTAINELKAAVKAAQTNVTVNVGVTARDVSTKVTKWYRTNPKQTATAI